MSKFDYKKSTSYKYRDRQDMLLGQVLSGTLDEDLTLSIDISNTPNGEWRLNPIFMGRCFSKPHKISLFINITDFNEPSNASYLNELFMGSINFSEVLLSLTYTGKKTDFKKSIYRLCKGSTHLEKAEVIYDDTLQMSGGGEAFLDAPLLKVVIVRSPKTILLPVTSFVNGIVDTLVFDSPDIVSLGNAAAINSNAFKSGGTGGTIYIPKVLYDHLGDGSEYDYKAATNWSIIDARGTVTWAQIEGSEYELT